ncbi:DUF2786 domain-containing protein [bacterium]|nr:DUF2786 domain-containing protein [bacterium]
MKNIEFKWAVQLVKEHKIICFSHSVNLTTPTINISSGEKTVGWWSHKNKTISISSHLIKNEIWDIVLEVLKHEIAHQYVSEFYDNADIHGKFFKRACKILGVHSAFIAGNRDYHKNLLDFKGALPNKAQKMLKKIEKLMALGESNNEAEALSASRKANYLLNKYNLQQANTSDADPDIKYLTICHKKKRIESIQRAILSVLNNSYYVNCITSNIYNAKDDVVYKSIVLFGQKEFLKVAEYVYNFLLYTAKTLWQEFKKKNCAEKREKLSFDMGFIAGIEHNHKIVIEDAKIEDDTSSFLLINTVKALLIQNQKENQKEISRLFPKLKKVRYGRHQVLSGAFKEGFQNGKNTQVNKSMADSGAGFGGFLIY